MALSYPAPKNGAVVQPSGTGADFASYDIAESQATESVAAYGAQVNDPHLGSGTTHYSMSTAAFARVGRTGACPFGIMTAGGGTATFTVDTGVTVAMTSIISGVRLSHSRLRAAVPLSFSLEGGGDATVTWAVT